MSGVLNNVIGHIMIVLDMGALIPRIGLRDDEVNSARP